ncbi:helix-turn-helix domain-containing protein [Hymenobacter gummosus]|uniref:Helix-turn-helix domain-containing protein n=1 Tax=Hymenobacter gummosus TaxID=1776032 RepID=A0A431U584_9BACT|nr:helix-turn-helix transcriptional regulator [Hymenobacter gummosus]RTQ51515.1 helix-turn-helix domain-containing protein [Hymenobacter gummosus]
MVERIRQLIQARQLSPTQFADAIGVARPIVSHILGGRNKPSLEVVQKIIAAFPDVALPWLLSGQGDMLAAALPAAAATAPEPPATPEPTPRTKAPRRSPQSPDGPSRQVSASSEPVVASGAQQEAASISQTAEEPSIAPVKQGQPTLAATVPTGAIDPAVVPLLASSSKSIRRVLIFYSDGTFADFSPSQDAF